MALASRLAERLTTGKIAAGRVGARA
jgi:hypothetical protein